jgi:hypothetical protein
MWWSQVEQRRMENEQYISAERFQEVIVPDLELKAPGQ